MLCVSKPRCTHGIIVSLWLICCISPIYPFLGQQPMIDVIIPKYLLFLCNFNVQCCAVPFIYITVCFVFNPFCKYMYCFTSPYFFFFFMAQVKDQQSHSLHLILVYFIFVTAIFRLIVFKFYDFVVLLQNHCVKSMKNVAKWELTLKKVSDNNLKFFPTVSSKKHIFMRFQAFTSLLL